jgi:hypothetical protein
MRGETVLFHGLKKDSGCALVLGDEGGSMRK